MSIDFLFQWLKRFGVYLLLMGLFILHLQFLTCDPALNFCGSRGPFTDEGLYLFQLRNYLNGHGFNLYSADTVLKSPLFSLLFFLPLKIVGIHLFTARFFALLFCFVPLLFAAGQRNLKGLVSVMVPMVFLEPFIFQYTHYSLAEMIGCCWIFCGLVFNFRYYASGSFNDLIIGTLIFLLVFILKIQFIYILTIPILSIGYICAKKYLVFAQRKSLLHFLFLIGIISIALIAFNLVWYQPNKAFFNSVVKQPYKLPNSWNEIWTNMKFNYEHVLLNDDLRLLTKSFYLFLTIGIFFLLPFKTSKEFKFLFSVCVLWIGIELHKLSFSYIPIRYLIPLLFAAVLLISLVVNESIQIAYKERNKIKYILPIFTVLASLNLAYQNLSHLKSLMAERTYVMHDLTNYIKQTIQNDGIIAGNWAPSLTWEVPNETMVVVSGVLNDEKMFTSIKPVAVAEEDDEADSDGAFKNRGIDLAQKSDSIKHAKIGRWNLNIFRIK